MSEKQKPHKRGLSIKLICYCALFTALSVLANTYTICLGVGNSNQLGFGYTVCFLSGAICGPAGGFIAGICGDVLGWLLNPSGGAFNPVITLSTGLIGLISGLTFLIAKKLKKENGTVTLTMIAYAFIFLICTNLNTVAIYFYYMSGVYSFWAFYAVRVPKQVIFWAVNMVVSMALLKPLKLLIKL
jgi:ECF transporter S component (folate family)